VTFSGYRHELSVTDQQISCSATIKGSPWEGSKGKHLLDM